MNENFIADLEEKLRIAMLNSDVESLNSLISEDLIFSAPGGMVISKQDDLNAHKSGMQMLSELTTISRQIKCFENFAVVAARMSLKGTFSDQVIDGNYSYTRTWANINEKWQVVSGHVSKI